MTRRYVTGINNCCSLKVNINAKLECIQINKEDYWLGMEY